MDKASCIARRKLLCREWTVEEIRFIHENLAVLKHDAQSFTNLPHSSLNMVNLTSFSQMSPENGDK